MIDKASENEKNVIKIIKFHDLMENRKKMLKKIRQLKIRLKGY